VTVLLCLFQTARELRAAEGPSDEHHGEQEPAGGGHQAQDATQPHADQRDELAQTRDQAPHTAERPAQEVSRPLLSLQAGTNVPILLTI